MTSTIALIEQAAEIAREGLVCISCGHVGAATGECCDHPDYDGGSPEQVADAIIALLTPELTTLLERCEKAEARVDELSETFTDENGTVWSPPTAWAYYAVCQARNNWKGLFKVSQTRAETAEASLILARKSNDILRHSIDVATRSGESAYAKLETAEAQVKELTEERDALKISLKIYGAHANECSGRYGPECDCGWRELKI